ncbi:hypothetical protein WN55_05783 [Dufourea novaeangliae]|uniref:Uncharacterized protein n=1 Tax=Dufourea novaeangliae TaxID=178035 RepID=A0A154P019_DUFNO|nr:hypothetical protein WN55_05783 [Dufourea novaeangliae]
MSVDLRIILVRICTLNLVKHAASLCYEIVYITRIRQDISVNGHLTSMMAELKLYI